MQAELRNLCAIYRYLLPTFSLKQEDEIIEEADIREEDIIDVPPVHSKHKPSKGIIDELCYL